MKFKAKLVLEIGITVGMAIALLAPILLLGIRPVSIIKLPENATQAEIDAVVESEKNFVFVGIGVATCAILGLQTFYWCESRQRVRRRRTPKPQNDRFITY